MILVTLTSFAKTAYSLAQCSLAESEKRHYANSGSSGSLRGVFRTLTNQKTGLYLACSFSGLLSSAGFLIRSGVGGVCRSYVVAVRSLRWKPNLDHLWFLVAFFFRLVLVSGVLRVGFQFALRTAPTISCLRHERGAMKRSLLVRGSLLSPLPSSLSFAGRWVSSRPVRLLCRPGPSLSVGFLLRGPLGLLPPFMAPRLRTRFAWLISCARFRSLVTKASFAHRRVQLCRCGGAVRGQHGSACGQTAPTYRPPFNRMVLHGMLRYCLHTGSVASAGTLRDSALPGCGPRCSPSAEYRSRWHRFCPQYAALTGWCGYRPVCVAGSPFGLGPFGANPLTHTGRAFAVPEPPDRPTRTGTLDACLLRPSAGI